eukprot:g6977.t1
MSCLSVFTVATILCWCLLCTRVSAGVDSVYEHNFGLYLAAAQGNLKALEHALVERKLITANSDHYHFTLSEHDHPEEYAKDWQDHIHDDQTALHATVRNGHLEPFKLLLKYGWSPLVKTKFQDTVLCFTARYGHYEMARILVEDYNVKSYGKCGNKKTALQLSRKPHMKHLSEEQLAGKEKIEKLLKGKTFKRIEL